MKHYKFQSRKDGIRCRGELDYDFQLCGYYCDYCGEFLPCLFRDLPKTEQKKYLVLTHGRPDNNDN